MSSVRLKRRNALPTDTQTKNSLERRKAVIPNYCIEDSDDDDHEENLQVPRQSTVETKIDTISAQTRIAPKTPFDNGKKRVVWQSKQSVNEEFDEVDNESPPRPRCTKPADNLVSRLSRELVSALHGLANSIRNNLHKQPEPWSQCPLRQESLTRTRAASQGHRRRSRRSLRRLADTAIHPYRPARRPSLDPAAVAPAGRPVRPPDTSPSPGGPSAERQPPAGRGPPGHGGAHRGPAGALWCGARHPGPKAAIHTHAHAQAATLLR